MRNYGTCDHAVTEQIGPDRCFSGSVAVHPYTEEIRAAHGCVALTEQCVACGARREVNVNQRHVEVGPWGPNQEARRAEAGRLDRLARAAVAAVGDASVSHPDGRVLTLSVDADGMVIVVGPHVDAELPAALSSVPAWLSSAQRAREAARQAEEARASV